MMKTLHLVAILTFLLAGCGDDTPPPPVRDGGSRVDLGDNEPDLGREDGGVEDSGQTPDGAQDFDAGHTAPECRVGDLLETCHFDESEDLFELAMRSRRGAGALSLAAGAEGFAAIYVGGETNDNIQVQIIPADGLPQSPVVLTDPSNTADGPAILSVRRGYVASWFDNSTGGFEIHTRLIGEDGMPLAEATAITNNELRDDSPSLVATDEGALLVWVEDDHTTFRRSMMTQRIDDEGQAVGQPVTVTGMENSVDHPRVSRIGNDILAGWVQMSEEGRNAYALRLNNIGQPQGDVVALSTTGEVGNTLDIDSYPIGGGASVFEIRLGGRTEIHFRPFDQSGLPNDSERVLTRSPEAGFGPGVVSLAGGYLAAYRSPFGGSTFLRLDAVDPIGLRVGLFDGPELGEDTGPLEIVASRDGRTILVVWSEVKTNAVSTHAARFHCTR